MPYYKSPQRLDGIGPGIQYTPSRTYWIKTYLIPPIDAGQPISLTVLSDQEGTTTVLLAYYDEAQQTVVGPALVNVIFSPHEKGLSVFTRADRSGLYLLMITSYNSSYTFYVTSVWSPFYGLRNLTIYAFGLIPIGLVAIYYDEIVEKRERMEEEALQWSKSRTRSILTA